MIPFLYVFGIRINTYGICAVIGVLFVVLYTYIVTRKMKEPFFDKVLFLIYAFTFSAVGGMTLYILTTLKSNLTAICLLFSDFEKAKQYFSLGIVFYGGLIGIFVGFMIYSKVFNEDVREWVRVITPSIPLFHIFGRIGCAFGGCCYGREVTHGGIYNALIDKYCFPIQLFEAIGNLLIFVVLVINHIVQKDKEKYYRPMGLYFIIYGIMRFILEFWRGDTIRGIWAGLSTSQYISLIIVPLGIYCVICKPEKNIFNHFYYSIKKNNEID